MTIKNGNEYANYYLGQVTLHKTINTWPIMSKYIIRCDTCKTFGAWRCRIVKFRRYVQLPKWILLILLGLEIQPLVR